MTTNTSLTIPDHHAILTTLELRFKSGNEVPVSSIRLTRGQFNAIKVLIHSLKENAK